MLKRDTFNNPALRFLRICFLIDSDFWLIFAALGALESISMYFNIEIGVEGNCKMASFTDDAIVELVNIASIVLLSVDDCHFYVNLALRVALQPSFDNIVENSRLCSTRRDTSPFRVRSVIESGHNKFERGGQSGDSGLGLA